MASSRTVADMRIGHGYDRHRLDSMPPRGAGRPIVLAGVRFDSEPMGVVSHSDGDVVYHAITDAILGALGEPDIGQLFPDDDSANENADSSQFLRDAAKRMAAQNFAIGNLDVTVICDRPKVSPHKNNMIANIAAALGCDPSQVNLKGKTHERADSDEDSNFFEAHAVVLLAHAR